MPATVSWDPHDAAVRMRTMPGSVLDVRDGVIVIPARCDRYVDAGAARQVAAHWPQVRRRFMGFVQSTCPSVGRMLFVEVEHDLHVALLCAYPHGSDSIDVDVYCNAIDRVALRAARVGKTVYVPHGTPKEAWPAIEARIRELAITTVRAAA